MAKTEPKGAPQPKPKAAPKKQPKPKKAAPAQPLPKKKPAPKKRQDKRGAPRGKGTVTANGGKIGNPPFEATDEQRKIVESHAAVGTPHEIIAEFIINPATKEPISDDTLKRHFKKQLDQGLARINARIGGLVAKAALGGCKTRQIFWMRTRAGWAARTEISGPGGGPIPTSQHPAIDPSKLTKDELRQMERLAAKGQPDADPA